MRFAALACLAALGVLFNALWLFGMTDDLGGERAAVGLVVSIAFAAAGLVAARRHPASAIGPAMIALVPIVNLGEAAAETLLPWRYTVGMAFQGMTTPLLAVLALSFPAGRLHGRAARTLSVLLLATAALIVVMRALWLPPAAFCLTCPPAGNVFFHGAPPIPQTLLFDRLSVALATLVALVMVTLLARWLRASRPARRVLAPVLLTTVILTAKVALDLLVLERELWGEPSADWRRKIVYPNQLLTAMIPLAFLAAVARSEFGRSPLVRLLSQVAGEGGPARVDRALAEALGDPGLRVGYPVPGTQRFVDLDGRPLELPDPGDSARATLVGDPADPLAVIVHDAALEDDSGQVEAAAAAAAIAIRRERLRAALSSRLRELSRSRARLMRAVDDQRERVENALERGVEARLSELDQLLAALRSRDGAPDAAAIDGVVAELELVRRDLRSFVNGVTPAIVAAEGLDGALAALAGSASVPVSVRRTPAGPLPAHIEATIWFLCAESLVNVSKHAHASRAELDVHVEDGSVHVRVADDGAGGATADGRGSGLRGLRERIEALGGTLSVVSGPASGTSVDARLPLDG